MDTAAAVTTAAAAAAAPSPSPSLPAPARRAVAWLVCTHLAWAAADAVICFFIASMWLLLWGLAATAIGRLACGEGCAVVAAAYEVASVAAVVTLVLLLPFTVLLMIARAQAATATDDIEAAKEPAPETLYEAMRGALCNPVLLVFLALMVSTLLKIIGALVMGDSPVMGSRRERMGSIIYDVGALGKYALFCFGVCPFVTVKTSRAWRKARHAL